MGTHKIFITVCIGVAVCLSGCRESKRPTVAPPAKVDVMVAQQSGMSSSRKYSGTLEESSGTDLAFEVGGRISSVSVNQGDVVHRGQVVATMDDASLHNAYNIAKSALDEAQDVYDRMKKLHDSNSISDMKWVETQNALHTAKNSEAIAQRTLSNATLRAPFTGYVADKILDAGTFAAPGLPVARIVVIDPIKVKVSLSEDDISRVKAGQRAEMCIPTISDCTYQGVVTERGIAANPVSRTYDVKISIDNPDGRLLPGMICDVRFETADSTYAIVLPYDAVLLDAENHNFVWLASGGKASKRMVTVGQMLDDGLAISQGISVGDSVIVVGQQKVSQGGSIEVAHIK